MGEVETKFKLGEQVAIIGTIRRIELTPDGHILYYMNEAPDVPIQEKDISCSFQPLTWRQT